MSPMNEEAQERHAIEELLPWHAAGTLGRKDAERVEAAIAADQELARRFELVREELAETIHLNETLGAPSARAMQKLFAAIEQEGATSSRARTSFALPGRVTEFLAGLSPRTLAWSATAAALAIVLQTAIITGVLLKGGSRPGSYEVASAEHAGQAAPQGTEVLIRFAPQASAGDVTRFLQAHQATIVSGPASDLYRVRVAPTRLPKSELDAIVKAMQSERSVIGLVLPANKD
jgi:anti-sigma factor RsiW